MKRITHVLFLLFVFLFLSPAHGGKILMPSPPQLAASAYILVDADTGKVIVENNADQQLPPASLTKMMTSYIVSEEMEQGRLDENQQVHISVKAWRMGGSKMYIREGTQVPAIDLLRGVIIQSGNDASVALAEHIAGSESGFVEIMNQQAQLLGMQNTHYENATGWPAEGHLTTARDLSKLAVALINDHPSHYSIYAEKYFEYNDIKQPNRNRLLWRNEWVDGIKTGHTEEAGYCLVASAKKEGMRLVSVVMGTSGEETRAAESQKLLDYGFRYYETATPFQAGHVLEQVPVWGGLQKQLSLGLANEITLTIPRGAAKNLVINTQLDERVMAPVSQGQQLGSFQLLLDDEVLLAGPVVALQNVEEAGFFARLWDRIKLFFLDLFSD